MDHSEIGQVSQNMEDGGAEQVKLSEMILSFQSLGEDLQYCRNKVFQCVLTAVWEYPVKFGAGLSVYFIGG